MPDKVRIEVDAEIADALRKLGALGGEMHEFAREADEALKDVSSSFSNVFGGNLLADMANDALGKVKGLLGGVMDSVIGGNAEMESYITSFEVMLGSLDKANTMVADLVELGASTPFAMPELASTTQRLLAFGIAGKDVLGTLKVLGDVSGGNAQKLETLSLAYGKAASAGKLDGEILGMMIDVGFNPLNYWVDKTGKSMSDLRKEMENGGISFEMLQESMTSATSEGGQFFGMMEKQSKTMKGLQSTLEDTVGQFLQAVGKPVFDAAKQGIILLLDALNNETVMKVLMAIGKALTVIVPMVAAGAAAYGLYVLAVNAATIAQRIFASTAMQTAQALLTNPIFLTAAAITAAVIALNTYNDWLNVTAAEHAELTKANIETNKALKEENESRQKQIKGTQELFDTYGKLANKTSMTTEEQKKYQQSLIAISSEYPGLIRSGDSFEQNMERISKKSKELAGNLTALENEMKALQQDATVLNMQSAKDQVDVLGEKLVELADEGEISTDAIKEGMNKLLNSFNSTDIQRAQVDIGNLLGAISDPKIRAEARQTLLEASNAMDEFIFSTQNKGKTRAQLEEEQKEADAAAKAQKAKDDAAKKAAEEAAKKAKEARDKAYAEKSADLKREEELTLAQMGLVGATEQEIYDTQRDYATQRVELAKKYLQEKQTISDAEHSIEMMSLSREQVLQERRKQMQTDTEKARAEQRVAELEERGAVEEEFFAEEQERIAKVNELRALMGNESDEEKTKREIAFINTKYDVERTALESKLAILRSITQEQIRQMEVALASEKDEVRRAQMQNEINAARANATREINKLDGQLKTSEKRRSEELAEYEIKANQQKVDDFKQNYAQPIGRAHAQLFRDLFTGTKSGVEAWKAFGESILNTFVDTVTNLIAEAISGEIALAAAQLGVIPAQSALATTLASVWATPAALSSIATGGASAAVGGSSVATTIAGIQALAKIPWAAEGMIATSPMLVGVGEAGDEAITPISKLAGIIRDAFGVKSKNALPTVGDGNAQKIKADMRANIGYDSFKKGVREFTVKTKRNRGV